MRTYDDYLISIGDYYDYECPECGVSLDRDTNSAIIILNRALEYGSAEINNILSMKQEALTST